MNATVCHGGDAPANASSLVLMSLPDEKARASIHRMLNEYNFEHTSTQHEGALDVLVVDEVTKETIGGLVGRTSLGMFFVDYFCLPKHMRGKGLGSSILAMAEGEAVQRGCFTAMLFTMEIQAPSFYQRHGYEVFGRIACNPPGNARIFMKKALRRAL